MERRFWLGVGILTLFLAVGLWAMFFMDAIHEPVCQKLEQAAQAAAAGDMDAGIGLAQQANELWSAHRRSTAAVADHTPMDEIDSLFAQMQTYANMHEQTHFAAYCARLSTLVRAIGDAHSLTWWNLM